MSAAGSHRAPSRPTAKYREGKEPARRASQRGTTFRVSLFAGIARERTTSRLRELLGFPPPGHPYWNRETLAGVAARYPGMDMRPYRDACRETAVRGPSGT